MSPLLAEFAEKVGVMLDQSGAGLLSRGRPVAALGEANAALERYDKARVIIARNAGFPDEHRAEYMQRSGGEIGRRAGLRILFRKE